MLTHPTLDKLHTLKCTGMVAALTEQMTLPDIDTLSFEERPWPARRPGDNRAG